MLIDVNCPLCQSPERKRFDRRVIFGEEITNHICTRCGLVYLSPRMPEEELEKFYEAEYRQLYQGSSGPNPKDLAVQQGRAQALSDFSRLKIQAQPLPKPFRHLDIGCSAGTLLEKFREEFGSIPVGIELGLAYRLYAQSRNLRVYASIDEIRENDEKPFDLISLAHVLEHIPNPVQYLARLRNELQAAGGLLLVEAPNLYGHDCFEIAHLVSYSPHSLTQTLKQAGYQVQALQVHGRPRSMTLPLYITILAKAGGTLKPGEVLPETGVRRKRRVAMVRRAFQSRLSPKKAWIRL